MSKDADIVHSPDRNPLAVDESKERVFPGKRTRFGGWLRAPPASLSSTRANPE
jgi:hypothetical protein